MEKERAALLALGASCVAFGTILLSLTIGSYGVFAYGIFTSPLQLIALYLVALAFVLLFPVGLTAYGLVLVLRATNRLGAKREAGK